ncbi:MAG: Trm112 family protein [Nitrospirae bacterium]|nr:Trm112 family protein [Nitrospirota bacterium]
MKKKMIDFLACPDCKGHLRILGTVESGDEIIEGILACAECGCSYQVIDSIPRFITEVNQCED